MLHKSKSRATGQDPGSENDLPNAFFRDWTGLEFLQTIMGNETVAPRVLTGNTDEGFLVMEDFGDRSPMENALGNGVSTEASQAMSQYGALLGVLHGVSAGKNDFYNAVYGRLRLMAEAW